jgi:NADPH2:quinone reductase
MKAARIHEFKGELRVDEVPEPQPGGGEVLARIGYAAVNPLDIWVTQGTVGGGSQKLPFVPGTEATARVDGGWAFLLAPGYGTQRDGFYQERVAVPRDAVVPLPPSVDPKQAAAAGVAGITAWRLVHDVAKLERGEEVLVLGASGGVGSILIQVAKNAGATIIAQTGNRDKESWVREQGADEVVVAEAAQLAESTAGRRLTAIFDPLGGTFTRAAADLLQPHGRLALFGVSAGAEATLDLRGLYRKGGSILGYGGISEPPDRQRLALEHVLTEMAEGRIRVPIDEVLPLERAFEAHRRILARQVRGKLVLESGQAEA